MIKTEKREEEKTMKKFLIFLLAIAALFILLANIGPLILLGVCVYLLYVIFKKFVKSDSMAGKVIWVLLGLFVLSVALSNIYAVIGLAALYFLYVLFRNNGKEEEIIFNKPSESDPFTNFERQWADMNK
jgi:lia operon protein LiaI